MDTREEFFEKIYSYYGEVAADRIPMDYLTELSEILTKYYYEQYQRFGIQYPKSIKRYSTFKIDDLEHPDTYEIIIKFLKKKIGSNYADLAKILLQKNDSELQQVEENISYYHNK